jgi:hypothetical protein
MWQATPPTFGSSNPSTAIRSLGPNSRNRVLTWPVVPRSGRLHIHTAKASTSRPAHIPTTWAIFRICHLPSGSSINWFVSCMIDKTLVLKARSAAGVSFRRASTIRRVQRHGHRGFDTRAPTDVACLDAQWLARVALRRLTEAEGRPAEGDECTHVLRDHVYSVAVQFHCTYDMIEP